jgi:hypothetical protein
MNKWNASPVHFSLSEALAFGLRSEHRITTGMASRDSRRNFKHSSSMESDMTEVQLWNTKSSSLAQRFPRRQTPATRCGASSSRPSSHVICHHGSEQDGDAGPKPCVLVAGDDWPG